jgi:hypothetical protein
MKIRELEFLINDGRVEVIWWSVQSCPKDVVSTAFLEPREPRPYGLELHAGEVTGRRCHRHWSWRSYRRSPGKITSPGEEVVSGSAGGRRAYVSYRDVYPIPTTVAATHVWKDLRLYRLSPGDAVQQIK